MPSGSECEARPRISAYTKKRLRHTPCPSSGRGLARETRQGETAYTIKPLRRTPAPASPNEEEERKMGRNARSPPPLLARGNSRQHGLRTKPTASSAVSHQPEFSVRGRKHPPLQRAVTSPVPGREPTKDNEVDLEARQATSNRAVCCPTG